MEIPPGYLDTDKDKDSPDEHVNGGIVYKRKYGDYLVWQQILSHTQTSNIETVVFVTDDSKADWWWIVKSDGPKTLGPRPELREEALTVGKISNFLMYKPEGFLKFATDFLGTEVSKATLDEVRDISRVRSESRLRVSELRAASEKSEQAVFRWLNASFSKVLSNKFGFPDFVAEKKGRKFGFEVRFVRSPKMISHRVRELAYKAHFEVTNGDLDMVTLVWITESPTEALDVANFLRERSIKKMPSNVRNLVGTIESDSDGDVEFVPIEEFSAASVEKAFQKSLFKPE